MKDCQFCPYLGGCHKRSCAGRCDILISILHKYCIGDNMLISNLLYGGLEVSTSWCESLRSSLSGVCKVLVLYLYTLGILL